MTALAGYAEAIRLTSFDGPWAGQVVSEALNGSWFKEEWFRDEEYRRGFLLACRTKLAQWRRQRDETFRRVDAEGREARR